MATHRIVMIDDSASDAMLLKMYLDRIACDHELVVLKDGEAALEFVEAERRGLVPTPCVFVLDIHMPKHDGLEILDAIKTTPVLEHVTVLVVSVSPTPEQMRRINAAGVQFLPKPTSIQECQAFAQRVWDLCKPKREVAA